MNYENNDKPAKVVRQEIRKAEENFDLFILKHISFGSADWGRYRELLHEYRTTIYDKEI